MPPNMIPSTPRGMSQKYDIRISARRVFLGIGGSLFWVFRNAGEEAAWYDGRLSAIDVEGGCKLEEDERAKGM